MSINVTSRGKLYTFPSGTKYSVIEAFLTERFANGTFIDDRGVVYTDRNIKDGSYTVLISMMANFEYEMLIFRMNSAIELRKHLEKEEAARRKHLLAMRELREAITTRHFYDSLSMNPLSFMNNLYRLNTCLMDESVEPSGSLALAASWIHFCQRGDAAPKQAAFITQEWVPKLVTTLLTRQYDWQRTSFSEVVAFLGMLRTFLEENLPVHGNSEAVQAALRDLGDGNQPFFTRYWYCVAQNVPLPPRLPDITNPDNRNWAGQKRTLDSSDHQGVLTTAPALKKSKNSSSPQRRRVRFDPRYDATFYYSPTSCPMETSYRFNYLSQPISDYYDIPIYRGTRAVHPKRCLLNDTEGGWVVVSRIDFDDAAALPECSPVPSSQSAIQG